MSDKVQADLTGRVRECYRRNNGRLFLVDDAKFSALEAVNAILAEETPSSVLFLAEDAAVASEISNRLRKIPRDSICITNLETLKRYLNLSASDYEAYMACAAAFRQEHPVVVVSATDEKGKKFFHEKLCKDTSKNGNYYSLNNARADFCVSDFFAACGYEFVAIDAVYSFLQFHLFREEENEPDPLLYEHLDFLGKSYFTDVGHSYFRLKHIAGAAKHCIAMSDTVFEQDVMELYAVLHLLNDSYSFVKQRNAVKNNSDLYNGYCEEVYNDLSNCKRNIDVQSDCVHFGISSKQRVPRDIASMEEYLIRRMKYTSEEEIFLQAIEAYSRMRLHGGQLPPDEIIGRMESETVEMSQCFMGMYFSDAVKGELESVLQNTDLHSMTSDEIAAVLNVFKRYGVARVNRIRPNEETVLRLHRDYSAFEYISRKSFPEPINGDCSYSLMKKAKTFQIKCLGVYDLLKENNGGNFRLPACIVVKDGTAEQVAGNLRQYFSGNVHTFADFGGEGLVVAEVSRIRKTASMLKISTAVLYDLPPDVFLLTRLVSKLKSMGDVRLVAMCSFSDMSGFLLNEWRGILFSPQIGSVPFGLPAIERKRETYQSYAEAADEIAQGYSLIVNCVEDGKDYYRTFPDAYRSLAAQFGDSTDISANVTKSDAQFFADTSESICGAVSNSVSAGRNGEAIEAVTVDKGKTVISKAPSKLIFNVCVRNLLRTCDIKLKDCNGCDNFRELHMNDFAQFAENTRQFFEKVFGFIAWRDKQLQMELSGAKINIDDKIITDFRQFGENAAAQRQKAEEALQALSLSAGKKQGVAYVEYEDVEKVLDAIANVYNSILDKYLSHLLGMFGSISGKLRTIYKTVCDGMSAAGTK